MKKCEVISYFTLKKFDELKNIVRANENNNTKDGELFVGDTFDCNEEMAKYLTGDNENKIVVVKIANEEKETNDDLKDNDENKEGNNEEENQTSNGENIDVIEEQEKENIDEEKPKREKTSKK